MLIMEQFPHTAASIVSFKVDSDVISLDGRNFLQTDTEIGNDGKIHVTLQKSISSRSVISSRRSQGLGSLPSLTPRPSNLTEKHKGDVKLQISMCECPELFAIVSFQDCSPEQGSLIQLRNCREGREKMGNCVGASSKDSQATRPETNGNNYQNYSQQKEEMPRNGLGGNAQAQVQSGMASAASPLQPRPAVKPKPMGAVLGRPMEDVRETYTIGRELGCGQFGVTYLYTHKTTGELFACKTSTKWKLSNKDDVEDVRREVQIMHHRTGQPNIVELKGAYEDQHSINLVMELCATGELFDRTTKITSKQEG